MEVLKLEVKSADKLQLFKATKGEAYAEKFAELLGCLEFLELHEAKQKIDVTVLTKVQLHTKNLKLALITREIIFFYLCVFVPGPRYTDSEVVRCHPYEDGRKWHFSGLLRML